MDYEQLKVELMQDMITIYRLCISKHKYRPTMFHEMLTKSGAVETARKLMLTPYPTLGFEKLWEYKDLDLTVEAMILNKPKYHEIFSREEIESCREKMKKYGYVPKGVSLTEEDLEDVTGQTLRDLARKVEGRNVKKRQEVEVFERNPFVSKCAREYANGVCELCGAEAPFKRHQGKTFP
jgi:hypothetical protein